MIAPTYSQTLYSTDAQSLLQQVLKDSVCGLDSRILSRKSHFSGATKMRLNSRLQHIKISETAKKCILHIASRCDANSERMVNLAYFSNGANSVTSLPTNGSNSMLCRSQQSVDYPSFIQVYEPTGDTSVLTQYKRRTSTVLAQHTNSVLTPQPAAAPR